MAVQPANTVDTILTMIRQQVAAADTIILNRFELAVALYRDGFNYTISDLNASVDVIVLGGAAAAAVDLTDITPTTGAYDA